MAGDIDGWLNIVDRLDVWGLGVLCLVGFWRIVRVLDRIERSLVLNGHKVETLEKWRDVHAEQDRDEHRRIHDRIEALR